MKHASDAPVAADIVAQASHWLMLHWQGPLDDQQQLAFETWHGADAEHQRAWARLGQLQQDFTRLPKSQALAVLRQQPQLRRRDTLKLLSTLLVAGGAGWLGERQLPWREAVADLHTATGQTLHRTLPDGTQLWLNTATAVDMHISPAARQLRLISGEILVHSGHDPAYANAPLTVQTAVGEVLALGTRFAMRAMTDGCLVRLYEGALQIRPEHAPAVNMTAGQALWFSATTSQAQGEAAANAIAWSTGQLVATQTPLGVFLDDLARYRPGVLRWTPAVARLPLTGVFPLADTDRVLAALEQTLPVRIQRLTRYWVSVDMLS